MTCKICLSVPVNENQNIDQLLRRVAQKKPDFVEFRLDRVSNAHMIEQIARKKSCSSIATDRSNRDYAAKEKLLLGAATAGFDFVDVDVSSPSAEATLQQARSLGSKVILSFHDNTRTPSPGELKRILRTQIRAKSDLCKVVTTAVDFHDNLSILQFLEEESRDTKLVSFAMGPQGVPSRILSPLFGAEFTIASFDDASKTAEGQLTIDNLRNVWQLLGVQ